VRLIAYIWAAFRSRARRSARLEERHFSVLFFLGRVSVRSRDLKTTNISSRRPYIEAQVYSVTQGGWFASNTVASGRVRRSRNTSAIDHVVPR